MTLIEISGIPCFLACLHISCICFLLVVPVLMTLSVPPRTLLAFAVLALTHSKMGIGVSLLNLLSAMTSEIDGRCRRNGRGPDLFAIEKYPIVFVARSLHYACSHSRFEATLQMQPVSWLAVSVRMIQGSETSTGHCCPTQVLRRFNLHQTY